MSRRVLLALAATCLLLTGVWLVTLARGIHHDKAPYAAAMDRAQEIVLTQQDHRVRLYKDSQHWVVAPASATAVFPIDEERWRTLDSALRNAQLEEVISDRADRASDYEVDAVKGLRVVVSAGGKTLVDGFFGKQAPDMAHLYFRFADGPTVYLARGLFKGELGGADVSGWRSHEVMAISEGQITGVEIRTKSFVTTLTKSSDTWTLGHLPADAERVDLLLGAIARLRADDFVDPANPAGPTFTALNEATVVVSSSQTVTTLHIGPLDTAAKRYPVSTAAANGVAWVAQPRLAAILVKPQDLLRKK